MRGHDGRCLVGVSRDLAKLDSHKLGVSIVSWAETRVYGYRLECLCYVEIKAAVIPLRPNIKKWNVNEMLSSSSL